MGDESIIEYRLKQAEAEIRTLKGLVESMRLEAQEMEHKRLLWGVTSLGSVVMALGGIIWAYRSVIFK